MPAQNLNNNQPKNSPLENRRFLSVSKAASLLKVSPSTLRRLESEGKITAVRQPNGYRMFNMQELMTLKTSLETQKVQSETLKKQHQDVRVLKSTVKNSGFYKLNKSIRDINLRNKGGALALAVLLLAISPILFAPVGPSGAQLGNAIKLIPSFLLPKEAAQTEIANVLGERDQLANFEFNVNIPTNLTSSLNVEGDTILAGSLTAPSVLGVTSIDLITQTTLENTLTLAGDVTGTLNNVQLAEDLTLDGTLNIGGVLNITGEVQVDGDAGSSGQVLTSTGNGVEWADVETDADTLDSLDSTAFLRSNVSDIYTSGTLSFSNGTFLDLSAITHGSTAAQGFRLPQADTLTNPSSGEGYLAYDTDADKIYIYNGSAWVDVSGASTTLQEAYEAGNIVQLTAAQGDIRFYNDGGDEMLFLDESNGRIGIGTTSPSYKLSVNGDIEIASGSELYSYGSATLGNRTYTEDNYVTDGQTFTASINSLDQQLADITGGTTGLWRDAGSYIYANNFDSMVITDSGRVGIGNTSPSYELDVAGALRATGAVYFSGLGTSTSENTIIVQNGSGQLITREFSDFVSDDLIASGNGVTNFVPKWSASQTLSDSSIFDNGINVGIGSSSPSDELHVVGQVLATTGFHVGVDSTDNLIDDATNGSGSTTLYIGNESILASGDIGVSVQGYDANTSLLGSSIEGSEITDGTIEEVDLEVTNSPTDNYILSFDNATGGFTWVDPTTAGAFDGTGTANYVPLWSDTDTLTSSVIYQTGGNLGIGTTAPSEALEIGSGNLKLSATSDLIWAGAADSTISATNGAFDFGYPSTGSIRLNVNPSNSNQIFSYDNIPLAFGVNNIETMRINTSGYLGIGTTNPTAILSLASADNAAGGIAFGTDTNLYRVAANTLRTDDTFQTASGFRGSSLQAFGANDNLSLTSKGTGDVILGNESTTYMTITDSGNVGIGTTNPISSLQVNGDIRIPNGNRVYFDSTDDYNYLDFASGTLTMGYTVDAFKFDMNPTSTKTIEMLAASNLQIKGANNKHIYITPVGTGNVGIGITNPTYKLDVAGDIRIADGSELYSYGSATLGDRTYTEDNYVTDDETFTASIDALDQQLADVVGGVSGLWTDQGTYIQPSTLSSGAFVIEDGGNVGIGTTDPSYALDVTGDIRASSAFRAGSLTFTQYGVQYSSYDSIGVGAGYVKLASTGNANIYIDSNNDSAANKFSVSTNHYTTGGTETELLTLLESGNLGLGTTNPGTLLSLESATADPTITIQSKVSPGASLNNFLKVYNGANGERLRFGYDQAAVKFNIAVGSVLTTPHFTIDGQYGDIGIGTTSPTDKLHVVGSALATTGFHVGIDSDATLIDDASNGSGSTTLYIGNESILASGDIGVSVQGYDANTSLLGSSIEGSEITDGTIEEVDLEVTNSATDNYLLSYDTATGGFTWVDPTGSGVGSIDGSGTANYLAKWTDDNTLAISALYETGGQIGIGTTSPSSTLHIVGDFTTDNVNINGNTIAATTSGGLLLHEDSGLGIYIEDGGNTGIGSTNPSSLLSVGAGNQFQVDSSGDIVKINNITYAFPDSQAGADNYVLTNDGAGNLTWESVTGGGGLGAIDGTGTTNYVPLWSDADTLTSSVIYQTSSKIGIGNTSPDRKLSIQGVTGAANTEISFKDAGSATVGTIGIDLPTTNDMLVAGTAGIRFFTGSTIGASGIPTNERIRITSAGLVGIGTTSPTDTLHIVGNALATTGFHVGVDSTDNLIDDATNGSGSTTLYIGNESILASGDIGVSVQGYDANTSLLGSSIEGSEITDNTIEEVDLEVTNSATDNYLLSYDTATGGFTWVDPTTAGAFDGTGTASYIPLWSDTDTLTSSVIYQTSGRIGIGTTAPAQALEVVGNIDLSGRIIAGNGTKAAVAYGFDEGGDTGMYLLSDNNLMFSTGNADRILIDSSGNVGIGTTDPKNRLHVAGRITSDFGTKAAVAYGFDEGGDTGMYLLSDNNLAFSTANVDRILINSSGLVGIGTTSPTDVLHVVGQVLATTGFHVGVDSTDNLIDDATNGSGSTTLYIGNESILASGDIGVSVQGYDANTSILGSSIEGSEITDNTIEEVDLEITNAGTDNYILSYDDATGGFTWIDPAGAGVGSVDGSGTANYLTKWTDSNTLEASGIYETGGNLGIGTTSPSQKIDVDLSSTEDIAITSALTGSNRTTDILTITQENNASFSPSGSLLVLSQQDTSATGAVMKITNTPDAGTGILFTENISTGGKGIYFDDFISGSGIGIQLSATGLSNSGTYILLEGVMGTGSEGIKIANITGGAGIDFDTIGNTSSTGILMDGSNMLGTGIYMDVANVGSGGFKAINLVGSDSGSVNSRVEHIINIAPTRSIGTTVTDTGYFINAARADTAAGGAVTLTDLVVFSSNCTVSSGSCTDASNILTLTQSYASASGSVLQVNNSGAGADIELSSTSPSISLGNGATLTVDDGTNNLLTLVDNGSAGLLGIGTTSPTAFLDLAASTTSNASLRLRSGTEPSSPNSGDLWWNGTSLNFYDGSTTNDLLAGGGTLDGSGTTNYIPIWSDSDTLGNSGLYQTGGQIGIGTTAPSSLLHVAGTLTATTLDLGTNTITDGNFNGAWNFNAGAVSGITTLSASSTIDFDGLASDSDEDSIVVQNADGTLSYREFSDFLSDDGIIDGIGTAGYITKYSDSNTLTNSVMFESSGKIGIGTTNPTGKLHVVYGSSGATGFADALIFESSANAYVQLLGGTGSTKGLLFGSTTNNSHGGIQYTEAAGLDFRTGGNNIRAYIDELGLFGILDSDPDAHLEVSADGGSGGPILYLSSTDDADGDLFTVLESGRVGIGTSNPSSLLHVLGSITLENGEVIGNATDDIITFVGVGGADNTDLYIDLDGTYPVLYSNTDTKVGINDTLEIAQYLTTSANSVNNINMQNNGMSVESYLDFKIQLDNDQGDTAEKFTVLTNGAQALLWAITQDGGGGSTAAGSMSVNDATPDAHLEVSANGTTGGFIFMLSSDDDTDGDLFAVEEGGDVGIGTTAPAAKLDVVGTLQTSSTVTFTGLGTGTDNSVLVLNSSNQVVTDEIDSRVWGTTLLDSSSGTANYLSKFSDGDTLVNSVLYESSSKIGIGTTAPDYVLDLVSSDTTGVLEITGDSVTTGTGALFSFDALTSGTGVLVESSPGSATTLSGDLFRINVGSNLTVTGNIFTIEDNGSELFSVNQASITSAIPHSFTAAGDVSIAYDLIFTNQTSSKIESYGPFTIEVGESHESSDLNLTTYNSGNIYANLGSGSTAASAQLLVNGDVSDFLAGFTNDGNADTRKGIFIQGCLDTNPTTTCNLIEFRDGNGTILGAVEGNGAGGVTNASSGSDYAELFQTIETNLQPGDILALDKNGKVVKAKAGTKLLGAYSTNPNTLGNWFDGWEKNKSFVPVGLLGQLPVAISDENGTIKSGDPISVSPTKPGVGVKSIDAQRIIGFAMEDASELNMVRVYISPTWHDPHMALGAYGELKTKVAQLSSEKVTDSELRALELQNLTSTLTDTQEEVANLKNSVALIEELLGLNDSGESTESSATSTLAGVSRLVEEMLGIYEEFKAFVDALGMNIDSASDTLNINVDLNVLGDATLTNVTIAGDLSVGQLEFDSLSNSINVLGASCYNSDLGTHNEALCDLQALSIQSDLSGNVDFFNGAILLEPDGTLNTTKFAINVENEESAIAGKAIIPAGETFIEVHTSALSPNSLILITPDKAVAVGKSIVDEDTFAIELESAQAEDITVDWLLVELNK